MAISEVTMAIAGVTMVTWIVVSLRTVYCFNCWAYYQGFSADIFNSARCILFVVLYEL